MKRIVTMLAMASISLMTMAQDGLRSGLDVTDFNQTVRPGDDFYEYACGGWMKKNPLPAAYSRYSEGTIGEYVRERNAGAETQRPL